MGKIATGAAGRLEVRNVSKRYMVEQTPLEVLSHINLDVESGRFISIVGPSGCGKSTLLRLITGLDDGYEGTILLNGIPVVGTSLERGIVFQDHRLLPWLTLAGNIALGLENSPLGKAEKAELIRDNIALVGLAGFEKAFPHQLSGGMAQRAAIARALVNRPKLLLLDEPFGALDALTRLRLQDELLRIWRTEQTTMILVTHDVDEAIFLSNEIVVMSPKPGRITQHLAVEIAYPRDRASHVAVDLKQQVLAEMGLTGREAA